nr:hypothetical 12.7K protein - shallot virus X [Shallot virus X]
MESQSSSSSENVEASSAQSSTSAEGIVGSSSFGPSACCVSVRSLTWPLSVGWLLCAVAWTRNYYRVLTWSPNSQVGETTLARSRSSGDGDVLCGVGSSCLRSIWAPETIARRQPLCVWAG